MLKIARLVAFQTGFQILGKIITSVTSLLALAVVTREFLKEDLGIFTLGLTYIAFFYYILDLGFNAVLIKDLNKNNEKEIFRKLLGLRLAVSLLLFLIGVFLAPVVSNGDERFLKFILIGLVSLFGYSVFISNNLVFQKKLKYQYSIAATSIGALINLMAVYIISFFTSNVIYFSLAIALCWLITGILSQLIFFITEKYLALPVIDWKFTIMLVSRAWPIALTLILNTLYFRIDAFILSYYKGFADVGIYNLAYTLFQSALVLPTFIMNSYYPILIKVMSDKRELVKQLYVSGGVLLGISLMGIVFSNLLGEVVIKFIVGKDGFGGSVEALKILSFGFPGYFLSALLMWVLISMGRFKSVLIIYLLGLIFNTIANIIIIPHYSYNGAALVTGASEYLILSLEAIILIKILKKHETTY